MSTEDSLTLQFNDDEVDDLMLSTYAMAMNKSLNAEQSARLLNLYKKISDALYERDGSIPITTVTGTKRSEN